MPTTIVDYTTDVMTTDVTATETTAGTVVLTTQPLPDEGGGDANVQVKAFGALLGVLLVTIVLLYIFGGRR